MANEKRLDLIDRNALIKNHDLHIVIGAGDNICIDIADIAKAPTVDAVKVKHGRWLPDMEEFDDDPAVGIRGGVFQTGWKCSICGRSEPVKEPYCNCGADMR